METVRPKNLMVGNQITAAQKIALTFYANQREKNPYTITVLDKSFIVLPGVFSPKYFVDTAFYSDKLPVRKGETILEIGCGTGIVSIFALLKGASSAVCVDINPSAIRNSIENAVSHNLYDRMDIRLGDVYEALKPDERFDMIFWNIPFGYSDRDEMSLEEMALFDSGYKAYNRFIRGSSDHLKKKGRFFFGCCPELSRFDLLTQSIDAAGLTYALSAQIETSYLHEKISFKLIEVRS